MYKLILFTVLTTVLLALSQIKSEKIIIENLDKRDWDESYYKYKIVNNIPYQFNPKENNYHFNPIYVTYFLKNYRKLYLETGDEKYIKYSKVILASSLKYAEKRMYNDKIAICFMYEPNGFVARMFHRHYSGLTQGYFVEELAYLFKITNDKYFQDLAYKFFHSLTIPIKDGGVMYNHKKLFAIAEVPMQPHGWILNGWLSAITSLVNANEILKSHDVGIFINNNIDTLVEVIDRFDVPSLKNSRYNLSQFFLFKLKTSKFKIKSISFLFGGEDPIKILPSKDFIENEMQSKKFSKWQYFVVNKNDTRFENGFFVGSDIFLFNAVLTNASDDNRILIEFSPDMNISKENYGFYILKGEYSPLSAAPINRKWIKLNNIYVENNTLNIRIDSVALKDVIGYPTNFIKKINNGRKNAYHDIHIEKLYYLGKKYNQSKLIEYSIKFIKYRNEWKNTDIYKTLFNNEKILLENNRIDEIKKEITGIK